MSKGSGFLSVLYVHTVPQELRLVIYDNNDNYENIDNYVIYDLSYLKYGKISFWKISCSSYRR